MNELTDGINNIWGQQNHLPDRTLLPDFWMFKHMNGCKLWDGMFKNTEQINKLYTTHFAGLNPLQVSNYVYAGDICPMRDNVWKILNGCGLGFSGYISNLVDRGGSSLTKSLL